jgi:hypothetical protein
VSDNLRSGLSCPTCGERVIGVYHEWNPVTDTATFEYMHGSRPGEHHRFRRKPCVVQMSIEDGRTRMMQESRT